MKAFAIFKVGPEGVPNIDMSNIKVSWNLCGRLGDFGVFMVSGTPAVLSAINAMPNTYPICTVSENAVDAEGKPLVRWFELDGVIAPAVRTKLNTFLTSKGLPTIPVGYSYRQTVMAIYKRMNAKFDIGAFDLADE